MLDKIIVDADFCLKLGGSEKYRFDKMLAKQVLTELSNVREEMNSELL